MMMKVAFVLIPAWTMTNAFQIQYPSSIPNLLHTSKDIVQNNRGTQMLFMQENQSSNELDTYNQSPCTSSVEVERRSFIRSAILSTTTLTLPFPALVTNANEDDMELESFVDSECGFKISVPKNWEKSIQSLPDRRKIVFFVDPNTANNQNDKSLIFIAYTPVRDDYTSLSSFGGIDQVAQMTILPKGKIAGMDDNESSMINAESKKNAYFFDYTIKADNQPKRHFRTIFSLATGATGGAGAMLVTLTAQASEERYKETKNMFDTIIDSYGKAK